MAADPFPKEFAVRTPCLMDWDSMIGDDDRKRFCAVCGKHVYNLTAMSRAEATSVVSAIRDRGERRCLRLYRRHDGSLGASSCEPAPAGARGAWQFTLRSIMAVIAGCAALLGLAKWLAPEFKQPPKPAPAAYVEVIVGDVY
jgi:hypothetical protein